MKFASDIQPLAVFMSLAFFFVFQFKYFERGIFIGHGTIFILFLFALYYVVNVLLLGGFFDKSLIRYLSLASFTFFGSRLSIDKKDVEKTLFFAVVLWGLLGFIQTYLDRGFGNGWLTTIRTSHDRGVTAFAPEPSHYGAQMLLIILFSSLYFKNEKWKQAGITWLCAIQIVLFSKSAMAVMLLVAWLVMHSLFFSALRSVGVVSFCTIGLITIKDFIAPGTRIGMLLKQMFSAPSLVFRDESVKVRIAAMIEPIETFQRDFPMFLGAPVSVSQMSGLGSVMQELGYLGFVYIGMILCVFIFNKNRLAKPIGLVLVLCLLNSVTIATPFVGIILGLATRTTLFNPLKAHYRRRQARYGNFDGAMKQGAASM